jgi:uncharacterized protein (TIRG00374 family)
MDNQIAFRFHIPRYVKIILFVGLLVGFFFYVPLQDIWRAVLSVDLAFFIVSALVGLPSFYLGAVRLWLLARRQGIGLSVLQLFGINLVVRFYSFFSPASVIGSAMRWYKLSSGGKAAEALTAVTFNRAFDLFIAIMAGLFWALAGISQEALQPSLLILLLLIIIIGWLTVTRASSFISRWFTFRTDTTEKMLLKNAYSFLGRVFNSASVYANLSTPELLALGSAGFASELIALLGYVLLAHALHISISIVDLGWMRSLFFLAALAPFTLVGGFGLREVSVVMVMSAFGVNPDLAVSFSLLLYARTVLLSSVGGMVELFSMIRLHQTSS